MAGKVRGTGKRVLTRREEWNICFDYVIGHPIWFISEKFNLSRSGIGRVLARNGVETNRGKRTHG